MGTPATLKFGVGSFTVMSWFKTTATVYERIVSTGMSGYSNGFDLGVNTPLTCSTGCVGAEIGGGSQAATVSFGTTATTFNDGNWHQAAMVIDQTANTAQLYVDGVAQALSVQAGTCGTVSGTSVNIAACISATATSSTDPFTLGAYHSGSTTNTLFTGSIDEVRVYNSALTVRKSSTATIVIPLSLQKGTGTSMRTVGPPPTIPLPTPIMEAYPLLTSSGLLERLTLDSAFRPNM